MVPGACMDELMLTVWQVEEDTRPQALVAVTQRFPPEVPEVTTMLMVPCPAVMDQPTGTAHV
jgi:hypothetical protein